MNQVSEREFDLILLDIMMPRMSGFEVCERLRQRFSMEQLPIIFLTARSRVTDLVSGLVAGANDYLVKPVSRDELILRVSTHLRLQQATRGLQGALAERTEQVKVLSGLLPICAECKKIPIPTAPPWTRPPARTAHRTGLGVWRSAPRLANGPSPLQISTRGTRLWLRARL